MEIEIEIIDIEDVDIEVVDLDMGKSFINKIMINDIFSFEQKDYPHNIYQRCTDCNNFFIKFLIPREGMCTQCLAKKYELK